MPVKQLLSFTKPIPAACACRATYSCPLRTTCAPNGGCPDILITRWPRLTHCPPAMIRDEPVTSMRPRAVA